MPPYITRKFLGDVPEDLLLERYRILKDLEASENRLISERTGNFLLATMILFGAFELSKESSLLSYLIPVVGIILNTFYISLGVRTNVAIRYWRTRLAILEEVLATKAKWKALTIFQERDRYYNGEEVEMPGFSDTTGSIPSERLRCGKGFFKGWSIWRIFKSTNRVQLIWIPSFFLILWLSLLLLVWLFPEWLWGNTSPTNSLSYRPIR